MQTLATENLFLLEFLVDNVSLDSSAISDLPPGETCVSFQFLDNAPMDVCEADFSPKRDYSKDADNVKSGKSCLFSLTPEQVTKAVDELDVCVTVFRKMNPDCLPPKVNVGTAIISISNLFCQLVQSVQDNETQSPTAKTLKDTFEVLNPASKEVGKINVYIRMSCFGKLIVTQFQMNLDDKSILFKDKEGQSLYRYKKAPKGDDRNIEDMNKDMEDPLSAAAPGADWSSPLGMDQSGGFPGGYNASCPTTPCYGGQGNYGGQNNYGGPNNYGGQNNYGGPSSPYGAPSGGPPAGPPGGMGGYGAPPMGSPQGYPPQQGYPQGGGGYPPTYPACVPPPPPGGYPAGQEPKEAPCNECDAVLKRALQAKQPPPPSPPPDPPGNYQEIGASMGGNALTIRVHKDKNKVEQVDSNSCCCSNAGSGKKRSSKQQDQQLLMGPGTGDQNVPPFSFRMGGGSGSPSPNSNIVVNPPTCTLPDGKQITEISDPNKEVFVLRIGKKSDQVGKKNNLELELMTPKCPEIKPKPKYETRDSQYDPKDCGPADKKGKKGKGEKGKNEKGGKGGKAPAKGGKGKKK